MKWFLHLSIRRKLYIVFAVIGVLLFIIINFAYSGIKKIRDRQEVIQTNVFMISKQSVELRSNLNRQRALILEMMLSSSSIRHEQLENQMLQTANVINSIAQNLDDLTSKNQVFSSKIKELTRLVYEYETHRKAESNLIIANKLKDAQSRSENTAKDVYERIRSIALDIDEQTNAILQRDLESSNSEVSYTNKALISISIFVLLSIIFCVFYLDKIIAKPTFLLRDYANKISEGDLYIDIKPIDRKDEIGNLWGAFIKMTDSLKEIAEVVDKVSAGNLHINAVPKSSKDVLTISVNTMVEKLRQITTSLKEIISTLGSSSSQIFASTAQLASSSTETATAIGETTSTVEEVKRASELSNNKSKEVFDVSNKANDYSELGERSIEETRAGINNIGEQMSLIADSTIKLSEQNKAISDIINAVNDISEQSNLLSVNASIEAARAGEFGKAFAVVAQEIKNLTEQSKLATSQVKIVLNDIQNGISSTVAATQKGEQIVDQGIKLAEQSSISIKNLADTVNIARDSALQTSVSSQEQVVGMGQIALAMENIRTASTQNAATTKQLEISAKQLQELGFKLKEIISNFNV
ncbi:MAG: methyl-accepting chemotaxis protein [Bacteroidota bacterium]|nr:methyl-accepting chemotaxis protein [Bacteroidota bacterium]